MVCHNLTCQATPTVCGMITLPVSNITLLSLKSTKLARFFALSLIRCWKRSERRIAFGVAYCAGEVRVCCIRANSTTNPSSIRLASSSLRKRVRAVTISASLLCGDGERSARMSARYYSVAGHTHISIVQEVAGTYSGMVSVCGRVMVHLKECLVASQSS